MNKKQIEIPKNAAEHDLLTVKETAEYLRMGETATREFLSMPGLGFTFRIKGKILIYKPYLIKWIETNCKAG